MNYPNIETLIEHTKYIILSEEVFDCCGKEMTNDLLKNILARIKDSRITAWTFRQLWGSTALGFGGIGGSAMTEAYTTVILVDESYYVYFDGRIAYKVENPTDMFFEDLRNRRLRSVEESKMYSYK